jgi:IS5 family transposase
MGLTVAATKVTPGWKRWVGLGVIADNLINIGRAIEQRAAR